MSGYVSVREGRWKIQLFADALPFQRVISMAIFEDSTANVYTNIFVPFKDHLQQTWESEIREIRQYSWLPKTPFRQRIIPKLLKSTNFVPNSTPAGP